MGALSTNQRLQTNRLEVSAKSIGLLILLLNVQLNLKQEAAVANSPTFAQQSSQTETEPAALCPTQLGVAIEKVTNRPEFNRGRWGILIQTLSRGNTLYSLSLIHI